MSVHAVRITATSYRTRPKGHAPRFVMAIYRRHVAGRLRSTFTPSQRFAARWASCYKFCFVLFCRGVSWGFVENSGCVLPLKCVVHVFGCECVVITLHLTTQPALIILIFQCYVYRMCKIVIKLRITAQQPGPVNAQLIFQCPIMDLLYEGPVIKALNRSNPSRFLCHLLLGCYSCSTCISLSDRSIW